MPTKTKCNRKKVNFKKKLKLANACRIGHRNVSVLTPLNLVHNKKLFNKISTINGPITIKQANSEQHSHHHRHYHRHYHHHYHRYIEIKKNKNDHENTNKFDKFKLTPRAYNRLETLLKDIDQAETLYAALAFCSVFFPNFNVNNVFVKMYSKNEIKDKKNTFVWEYSAFLNQYKSTIKGSTGHCFVTQLEEFLRNIDIEGIDEFNTVLEEQLQLYIKPDDEGKESKTEKGFNWKILSKYIRNFENADVLKLGIICDLNQEEIMLLNDIELMRILNSTDKAEVTSKVYIEIAEFGGDAKESIQKVWWFCDGLVKRYFAKAN